MSVVIADKSAAARMEKPVMITLTDREKALVEAARLLCHNWTGGPCVPLQDALRAYGPPKEKVYVLPTWGEFVSSQEKRKFGDFIVYGKRLIDFKIDALLAARSAENDATEIRITEDVYNFFREATAKEKK